MTKLPSPSTQNDALVRGSGISYVLSTVIGIKDKPSKEVYINSNVFERSRIKTRFLEESILTFV